MKNTRQSIREAALAAAAALLLAGTALGAEFTDAAQIAHPEAVAALAERGVLDGLPDGSFQPNGAVRRSEMAKMLSRLLDPEVADVPSSGFTDVPGTWAERYIDHCYRLGLVSGRGDGTFDPDGSVTGRAAAKMLLAACGYDAAEFTGPGWGSRVDAAAEEAGLYDGFTAPSSEPLTRDGAALLVYNGLRLLDRRTQDLGFPACGIAALPDGSLLLTDTYHRTVVSLKEGTPGSCAGAPTVRQDGAGRPLGGYYDAAAGESAFGLPWAVAPFLEGYAVSDPENNAVRIVLDGRVKTVNPVSTDASASSFSYPTGLAAGEDGCLYVSDTRNGRICRVTPDGKVSTVARGLQEPMGLCWQDGVLYIAEAGANRVLQLKDGKVSTAAGSGGEGMKNGASAAAQFSGPQAVAADTDGTLYVSDTGNGAIRRVRDGQVETLLSTADEAMCVCPAGLLVRDGTLYACDRITGTLLVRRVS